MSYAKVTDNSINKLATRLPETAQRLDNGAWVMALRTADTATQEACGWFEVDDTAVRPDDTATTTSDRSVELVVDVPTVIWTVRNKTRDELDADADADERQALRPLIAKMTAIINDSSADTVKEQRQDIARLVRRLARDSFGDV